MPQKIAHLLGVCAFVGLLAAAPARAADPVTVELKDGDTVAFIGDGFFEREGEFGYLETALTLRFADRDIKFRNLGWEGDTVWCDSRNYFGDREEGFQHLLKHVDVAKPTVIMLNYGGNESFAGEAGLEPFLAQYNRLLTELEKRTKRIVLMSPLALVQLPKPMPDVTEANKKRAMYAAAIKKLAGERGYGYIQLSHDPQWAGASIVTDPITEDGVHLSKSGHWIVSQSIALQFGTPTKGKDALDIPKQVRDRIGEQCDQIREAIVRKNELFFHRHRPQNETYLRGFRKHEQGNNEGEIYEFEKYIASADADIAELRKKIYQTITGTDQ